MNSDLSSRILPAVLYVLSIVGCTLFGSGLAIILMQIFFVLCLYEYVKNSSQPKLDSISLLANIAVAGLMINLLTIQSYWVMILTAVSTVFLLNGGYLITTAKSVFNTGNLLLRSTGYITVAFASTSYLLLSADHYHLTLLGTFILLWLNDAGAYFVGRAVGKRKILPKVSPGKSWEGWIGGVIIAGLSGLLIHYFMPHLALIDWMTIGVLVAIFGLVGDLVESSWKRSLGLKDSGHLLGGHGGFLDRLDSFIYSIPFVNLYLLLTL